MHDEAIFDTGSMRPVYVTACGNVMGVYPSRIAIENILEHRGVSAWGCRKVSNISLKPFHHPFPWGNSLDLYRFYMGKNSMAEFSPTTLGSMAQFSPTTPGQDPRGRGFRGTSIGSLFTANFSPKEVRKLAPLCLVQHAFPVSQSLSSPITQLQFSQWYPMVRYISLVYNLPQLYLP